MKELDTTPHKYQEICDNILARIESGELEPGTRLPGVRALGEQYGCNYHTVRHAFETLAEQGYVELKRGSGTFVTERATDFKKRKVSTESCCAPPTSSACCCRSSSGGTMSPA